MHSGRILWNILDGNIDKEIAQYNICFSKQIKDSGIAIHRQAVESVRTQAIGKTI